MWSSIFQIVVTIAVLWFVWSFISRRLPERSQPADPGDYAGSPARLRPRPRSGAGAIALAEPDDEDEDEPPPIRRIYPR